MLANYLKGEISFVYRKMSYKFTKYFRINFPIFNSARFSRSPIKFANIHFLTNLLAFTFVYRK
jgi:hypothetical protein